MSKYRAEHTERDPEPLIHALEGSTMAPQRELTTVSSILHMVVREVELHIPRASFSTHCYDLRKGGLE